MRPSTSRVIFAVASIFALTGCGYVHFGRLPAPAPAVGQAELEKKNAALAAEKKLLEQELALSRKEGVELRAVIASHASTGTASPDLVARLDETTNELAALRTRYVKLQAEREHLAVAPAGTAGAAQLAEVKAKLGETEEKLAGSLHNFTEAQAEITRLRAEVAQVRTENTGLTSQVKDLAARNQEAQAALAQLNTELLAQKESRAKAEQEAESLKGQLSSARADGRAASAGAALALATPSVQVPGEASSGPPTATLRTNPARLRAAAAGQPPSLPEPAASPAGDSVREAAALAAQLDTLRAKVTALESERAKLQGELAARGSTPATPAGVEPQDTDSAKLAVALRSYTLLRDENDELKAAQEKAAAEKSALEAQLAVTKSAVPIAAQATALREQLRQTQAQLAALSEENNQLKTRLALGAPVSSGLMPAPTRPGSVAAVPAPAPVPPPVAAPAPRLHVVADGDTLSKISRQYYGTTSRWTEILDANRDILRDEKSLVVGRTLRIP